MKLSIILPVYNVAKFLEDSINSLTKQTLQEIEIICINDGSTDDSLEILKNFQQKDKRIIVLDQENQGSGIARNNGMKIANGEYIGFLDPDDYLPNKDSLFKLYNGAKKFDSNICGGNFKIVAENDIENISTLEESIRIEEKEYKNFTNFTFKEEKLGKVEDYKSSSWFWRFIYKRSFLENNKINFPDYKRFQDVPFLAKALSLTENIYFLNEITHCYRINHKIMRYKSIQKKDILSALKDCFEIYNKHGKNIQYSDLLTTFIEMTDVFSHDIKNNIEIDFNITEYINNMLKNINFNIIDFSIFWKKDIKNLKGILIEENYNKLLNLNDNKVFYD